MLFLLFLQQNNRPAIVIVHGGGWVADDKRDAVYTNLLVDYAMKGLWRLMASSIFIVNSVS